jgi:hypothetical protein
VRIARALDRDLAVALEDNSPLAELMDFYGKIAHIRIRLAPDALKAAGIDERTRVPLTVNARLTLRAWLNLALDPYGLTYVPDGDGLRIVRRATDNIGLSRPSARQESENALVAEALKAKVTFAFKGEPWSRVIADLAAKTNESFVLDPVARRSGTIKPEMTVTGTAIDEPLAAALKRLLAPIGMTYVIRNETVVLTAAR